MGFQEMDIFIETGFQNYRQFYFLKYTGFTNVGFIWECVCAPLRGRFWNPSCQA